MPNDSVLVTEAEIKRDDRCTHGGAFFDAIGDDFENLDRRRKIINADVLDAWFPPAPEVLERMDPHWDWIVRTSPPTHANGLVRAIADAREVPSESIAVAAGSSDLIYDVLPRWLSSRSRVLILDPMYGEYAQLLEQIIGCDCDRFHLHRDEGYQVDPSRLAARIQLGYDMVILVNPNSPTGRHVPTTDLRRILSRAPRSTRIWVDETYVDYVEGEESLEGFAAKSENVFVCKSMSKAYALSGLRVGYLCGPPAAIAELNQSRRPWTVSLPAQIAAVVALQHPAYYRRRYEQTSRLRNELARSLRTIGLEVIDGAANFLLCHLPQNGPTAAALSQHARDYGLFVRDVRAMGQRIGEFAIRVAVKDRESNRRTVEILEQCLSDPSV